MFLVIIYYTTFIHNNIHTLIGIRVQNHDNACNMLLYSYYSIPYPYQNIKLFNSGYGAILPTIKHALYLVICAITYHKLKNTRTSRFCTHETTMVQYLVVPGPPPWTLTPTQTPMHPVLEYAASRTWEYKIWMFCVDK